MAPWLTEVFGIPTGLNDAVYGSFVCYEKIHSFSKGDRIWKIRRTTKKPY